MMDVTNLRGYGIAGSDAEANWSQAFKAKLKKTSQKVVMKHLNLKQKFQVLYWFAKEKKRSAALDLSDIRAKGMKNDIFIKQQLEYLSIFSTLKIVVGLDSALNIMYAVMDATAEEALLLSLPEVEAIRNMGEPFEVLRSYSAVFPETAKKAGCHEGVITEEKQNSFQFDIHYCVWLELAKKMNVPEACIPNCYADDLAYPKYFESLGIKYTRTGTLAKGNACCDLRFEKMEGVSKTR
ncbi:MAG: L-2-amino-thiazoline-4-carboxylic acid hydrolase [Ignavibacteriaceae bacterium]|jgi:hypothetical protein